MMGKPGSLELEAAGPIASVVRKQSTEVTLLFLYCPAALT